MSACTYKHCHSLMRTECSSHACAWAGMLMQKFSSPANATKALSNLVGVAGAHIDALDAQGMHDKLYFNWTAFTQPEAVRRVLDYTQARSSIHARLPTQCESSSPASPR